jgi:hypothetical protein
MNTRLLQRRLHEATLVMFCQGRAEPDYNLMYSNIRIDMGSLFVELLTLCHRYSIPVLIRSDLRAGP